MRGPKSGIRLSVLADLPLSPAPPCLSCGACCFSRLRRYVRVTGEDYTRLGERAEELAAFDGHRAFMRMQEGHCAALQIDAARAEYRCSAYEIRPDVCRDLERQSPSCDAERTQKAERALIALRMPI